MTTMLKPFARAHFFGSREKQRGASGLPKQPVYTSSSGGTLDDIDLRCAALWDAFHVSKAEQQKQFPYNVKKYWGKRGLRRKRYGK